ncbi:MAG TPA: ABC transporter permease [Gemmatimonadaceae bacterium]
MNDLAFAFRALRRSPGFTLVALLTLALGVGANSAIFSVVDGVLLKPLQLNDPSRLVALGEQTKQTAATALNSTSPGSFYDWQSHATKFHIAGMSGTSGVLTGHGDPQPLVGVRSIGGLMDVLGVQPLFGRLLTVADEDPSAPRTIVLSFDAWRRLFGEDRNILGTPIDLSGVTQTIVGVMPAGFTFPGAPIDFWTPSRYDAQFRANRDQYFIDVVGRLTPGTTLAQAQAEMSTIGERLARDWPKYNQGMHIAVVPLQQSIVGDVRNRLLVLMGAVAFVLLITCANLGNLLLARASTRRREIAVRQALGAGRTRIVRQMLTESMVLALVGGTLGLLVGKVFLRVLLAAQATTNLPRVEEITLDGRVLVFTLLISVAAGLVFGCIPAWQSSGDRFTDALRDGSRGSARHQVARGALVVSELALAMVLLTGAGLLLRSFALLQRVNPGVRSDHVLTFSISPRAPSPSFFSTALDQLRAIPGVKSVALTSGLPIAGRAGGAWFNRIDRPLPDNVQPTGEPYRVVTPDYFATVGIPLRRGRFIDASDRREVPVIVVNEALVKKYYPGEDPIGKLIYLGAPENRLFDSAPIVGVVGDTHDAGLGVDALPTVYIPQAVIPKWTGFNVVIRTSGEPNAIVGDARRVFRALDPTLPLRRIQTLDDVVSASTAPARWSTILLGVFAGVALVMAVLGVFGVLSFIVTQRTRELGIRIALGASASRVQRLVIVRGMALAACGLAVGIVGSLALSRFMSTLLYGVTTTDPTTFIGVSAILVIAAALASYLPARRATRVDPIIALRAE